MKILISEKLSPNKYRTPEGYLICKDAILARTGPQTYLRSELWGDSCDDADAEINVDRKPEEVFSAETLASFENKPITVEHPDEDVTSTNYKEYSVGFVRDVHKGEYDGQPVILGTLVIQDEQTIEEILDGKHTELSCGYDCDIEDEDNPQQRNIRGNHVALCEQGRAGNARIVDSIKDNKGYTKGIIFNSDKNLTNNRFIDFMSEGIGKLDESTYVVWWHDGKQHQNVEQKYDGIKNVEYFYFDLNSETGRADDYDFNRMKNRYRSILQIKANKYVRDNIDMKDAKYKSGDKLKNIDGDIEIVSKVITESGASYSGSNKVVTKYIMKSGHKYEAADIENKSWKLINDSCEDSNAVLQDLAFEIIKKFGSTISKAQLTKYVETRAELDELVKILQGMHKNIIDGMVENWDKAEKSVEEQSEMINDKEPIKVKRIVTTTDYHYVLEDEFGHFWIVSKEQYHKEKEYMGGAVLELSESKAIEQAKRFDTMEKLERKYGKSEGYKRYMAGYEDSCKDAEDYVLYKQNGIWRGTTKANYDARISNANLVNSFKEFDTADEIKKYLAKYMPSIKVIKVVDTKENFLKDTIDYYKASYFEDGVHQNMLIKASSVNEATAKFNKKKPNAKLHAIQHVYADEVEEFKRRGMYVLDSIKTYTVEANGKMYKVKAVSVEDAVKKVSKKLK